MTFHMVKWFFLSLNFTWAIKYWVLKVCMDHTCPSLYTVVWSGCSESIVISVIDVTWEHTVTVFQLWQLQANDIRPIKLDMAFHLHPFWKWIPLGKQFDLWHICVYLWERKKMWPLLNTEIPWRTGSRKGFTSTLPTKDWAAFVHDIATCLFWGSYGLNVLCIVFIFLKYKLYNIQI